MIKCFYPTCLSKPGEALFRINEKGVIGIWACREHLKNTDVKILPEVDELVKVIEEGKGI